MKPFYGHSGSWIDEKDIVTGSGIYVGLNNHWRVCSFTTEVCEY